MKIKPPFADPSLEAVEEAERVAREPDGLDELKRRVERPWDAGQAKRLGDAGEALTSMLATDLRWSKFLKPLPEGMIEAVEKLLASSQGRDQLFGRTRRVFKSCEGISNAIASTLEEHSPATSDLYFKLYGTVHNDGVLEHLEREAAEAVLQRAGVYYKRAPRPLGLRGCLNIIEEAGGFFPYRPLLRVALRDYRALAFQTDGGGTRLLAASDWLHRPLPPAEEEGWRFVLVQDLPHELRAEVGYGPRGATDVAWEREVQRALTRLVSRIDDLNPYRTKAGFVSVCKRRFGLGTRAAERAYEEVRRPEWERVGPKLKEAERLREFATLIETATSRLEAQRPAK